MKTQQSYDGVTVMLDLDVLDNDGCPECVRRRHDLDCILSNTTRCEECQAAAEEIGEEIEERVYERFPGSETLWLHACDMGSHKAANPDSMWCPDDIYEAVLG
jgi:hypothetical protein